MKYFNITQNTEEWYALRLGKATSSNFGKIMANLDKGFGKPAMEYALKTVLEGLSGESVVESYSNGWMEQGHEREPVARDLYESATFNEVLNGGFCQHKTINGIGCSPDGLVFNAGEKGGIEIKCPKFTTHYATIKRDSFDPSYRWQLLGNMWICELDWIDFVSYSPEFPESKQLFIHRLKREDYEKELGQLKDRVMNFMLEVAAIKKELT